MSAFSFRGVWGWRGKGGFECASGNCADVAGSGAGIIGMAC